MRYRVGPYELHSPLDAGGSGQVWQATERSSGLDVAVKIFPRKKRTDSDLIREIQALALLDHPHVLPVYTTTGS